MKKIPLSIPVIKGNEWKYLKECLDTGWVSSGGSFIGGFEKAICRYVKAVHAVACLNGTLGLFLALKQAGVRHNEEAIVPDITFIAPVNAVRYLGAEPVFMDCDDYLNMDPLKLEEFCRRECKITKSGLKNKKSGRIIKAIVAVHVFGNPCDLEKIMRVAKRYGLKVVEDAAESLGSYYTEGRYKDRFTATIGDFGVYSFNGNKIITSGGGGMIVTNNEKAAQKIRYLINQAKDDPVRYIHNEIGYNFRLTNIQAALGLAQLENLKKYIRIKKRNYGLYKNGLKAVAGINLLGIPKGTSPNYWFYSITVDEKTYGLDKYGLLRRLHKAGIEARPLWYPSHLQKPYLKNRAYKIERSMWFWKRTLNIPCSVNLTEKEINRVLAVIKR